MRSGAVVASKYRIVRELGSGGMGSVWHAVHLVTERDFAIKFLHPSCASSASLLARFFQEARVSGKLRHPSIIEIFDVGTSPELGGAPFLVMELLDGASLDVLVRKLGALPPRTVLETIAEAAHALALAHDKGIVHRDLKPANLFLHRPGTGALVAKVLDFGISKIATAGGPDMAGAGLTQTGAVLGSPLYMSPEQAASDRTIDGRSDIHALGVVLFECLAGKAPFDAENYNNLVVQIITGDRPRLSDAFAGAPPAVSALVEKAMARKREDRFQTASALAEAIEAILPDVTGTPLTARTSAAELFARVAVPSVRPEPLPAPPAGTTTGGMAVPSTRAVNANASPMAVTEMPPARSHSRTAFDETHPSNPLPLAQTVDDPGLARSGASAVTGMSAPRPRWPALAGAAVLLVVVGGGVATAIALRHPAPGSAPAVSPEPPVGASAAAVPSASASLPAQSAGLSAIEPPLAPPPSATHAPALASASPVKPPVPPATSPVPAANHGQASKPPAKRPKDSVESSGF